MNLEGDVAALAAVVAAWADEAGGQDGAPHDSDVGAVRAVRALAASGASAQAAVPVLVRAAHADPRGMGEVVADALGKIGGEAAIRELNRVWWSGWDRKLCEACTGALSHLAARAHPVLLRIADEADALARMQALHSLRAAGYPAPDLTTLASAVLDRAPEALRDAAIAFLAEVDAAVATASGTRRVGPAAPGPPLAADCRHRRE